MVDTGVVWGGHDSFTESVHCIGESEWGTVVATGAGADRFTSREVCVRAGIVLKSRVFWYFPVRVILDVVGSTSSDPAATFLCLDRVIAAGSEVFHLGETLILFL